MSASTAGVNIWTGLVGVLGGGPGVVVESGKGWGLRGLLAGVSRSGLEVEVVLAVG